MRTNCERDGANEEDVQQFAEAEAEGAQVPGEIPGVHEDVENNEEALPDDVAGVDKGEADEEEAERNEEQEEIPGVDENAQYDNEAQQLLEDAMNAKYGPCSGHYNLRSRRECDYSHLFAMNNALHSNPRTGDKRSPDHENGQDATSA